MMNFWWGQQANERRVHWIKHAEMVFPKTEGGMGFRDLCGVNTAMLAKQMWSLFQRPSSLIGRILKAKYHKHSSILEANIGYRPSFIWRSLISAQEFLWSGLRWKVGNGASIRVWGDRWIPSTPGYCVPSPPVCLDVDAKVRDLIDPQIEQWDVAIVESCFSTAIAELSCKFLIGMLVKLTASYGVLVRTGDTQLGLVTKFGWKTINLIQVSRLLGSLLYGR
ncbi:Uncharacterized mitochondrial protein AtMg00310 [Linum grandiflorum]